MVGWDTQIFPHLRLFFYACKVEITIWHGHVDETSTDSIRYRGIGPQAVLMNKKFLFRIVWKWNDTVAVSVRVAQKHSDGCLLAMIIMSIRWGKTILVNLTLIDAQTVGNTEMTASPLHRRVTSNATKKQGFPSSYLP